MKWNQHDTNQSTLVLGYFEDEAACRAHPCDVGSKILASLSISIAEGIMQNLIRIGNPGQIWKKCPGFDLSGRNHDVDKVFQNFLRRLC